ncbi:MAG: DUF488 domain-containing protein [Chloroflexota bacterium]|nr:DUF488 domain-containing protein [Chloroflexota bacterium]
MNKDNTSSTIVVYTIGHSNRSIGALFKNMSLFTIQTLVDIRSKPYSRYVTQFNKNRIANTCAEQGVKYVYLGNCLGGKSQDRSIRNKADKIDYELLAKKDYFVSGIDQILVLATKSRICLMCSEGHPNVCHRGLLIGPILEKKDVKVLHILPEGMVISTAYLQLSHTGHQLRLI